MMCSAFDGECVEEIAAMRGAQKEAPDDPFQMSYELTSHTSDAVHSLRGIAQPYNSSAPEPIITAFSFCHAHRTRRRGHDCSGNRSLFNEVVEDLLKAVIHIERHFIGHLRIDQTPVQGHRDLVFLLSAAAIPRILFRSKSMVVTCVASHR